MHIFTSYYVVLIMAQLKIIVLMKQVPDPNVEVEIDEKTGVIKREKVEAVVNPLDLHALEEALRIKERHGAHVTVISMGPPMAEAVLREAIALGADRAILLSDRALAGSDTLATSYALSKAIEKVGEYDLILCGLKATDGETGQVGPEISSFLGIPVLTYVRKLELKDDRSIVVERIVEGGYQVVEASLPAIVTVVREINEPRLPTLRGKIKAKSAEIETWTVADIGVDPKNVGLEGSPTRVVKVYSAKIARKGRIVSGEDPEKAVDELIKFLMERGLI